jgi:hypothetical protein
MATCPRCGGHLHETHTCQGLWRIGVRVIVSWFSAALLSGAAAGTVFYLMYGYVSWGSIVLAGIGGILVQRSLQLGEP